MFEKDSDVKSDKSAALLRLMEIAGMMIVKMLKMMLNFSIESWRIITLDVTYDRFVTNPTRMSFVTDTKRGQGEKSQEAKVRPELDRIANMDRIIWFYRFNEDWILNYSVFEDEQILNSNIQYQLFKYQILKIE